MIKLFNAACDHFGAVKTNDQGWGFFFTQKVGENSIVEVSIYDPNDDDAQIDVVKCDIHNDGTNVETFHLEDFKGSAEELIKVIQDQIG